MLENESGPEILEPEEGHDGQQGQPDQHPGEDLVHQGRGVDAEVFVAGPGHERDVSSLQVRVHSAEGGPPGGESPSHERAVDEDHRGGGRGRVAPVMIFV